MAPTQSASISPVRPVQLGGAHAWWVWALSVLFVIYLFSVQTGYSIVNPDIARDVSLSVTQVSTIAAVYTWVFAVCQFFGGALLDRLGAHKVLPASVVLVMAGVFLFANAESYGMLVLSQFVMAVGACTGFVGGGYIGGQWFGMARFSFMFGLVQFCASLSSAFSVNALQFALERMDWRTLFNYVGAAGVVLALLAIPVYDKPGMRPDNMTVLDRDYVAGFWIALAVVWACVPLAVVVRRLLPVRQDQMVDGQRADHVEGQPPAV